MKTSIKIYGAERCHKSVFYKNYFKAKGLEFEFFDVEGNESFAEELRNLYDNRKLHFPTLVIKNKRMRNPSEKDIEKQLAKLKLNDEKH